MLICTPVGNATEVVSGYETENLLASSLPKTQRLGQVLGKIQPVLQSAQGRSNLKKSLPKFIRDAAPADVRNTFNHKYELLAT